MDPEPLRPRPLADRIAGLDQVVTTAAEELGVAGPALTELRAAVADSTKRHGDLLDYFERGGQQALVVAEGIVPFWPDDAVVEDGWPRHGIETTAVAAGTLATVTSYRTDVLELAARLAEHLRSYDDKRLDLAELVVIEICEALCFTDLIDHM